MRLWRRDADRVLYKQLDRFLEREAEIISETGSLDVGRLRHAIRDAAASGMTFDEWDRGVSTVMSGRAGDRRIAGRVKGNPVLDTAWFGLYCGWADLWGQMGFSRETHGLLVTLRRSKGHFHPEEFMAMAAAGVEPSYVLALTEAGFVDYGQVPKWWAANMPVDYVVTCFQPESCSFAVGRTR